jgi:multiple sugar transport system ATP-binding protein
MAKVELKRINKSFGDVSVLSDIDLEIEPGSFTVFVGPSGCGKSTLLRIIAGLEDPSSGELCFDGLVVNELAPARREIAMVFQSYALYPHMNVRENLAFGLKLRKTPASEIEAAVNDAARMLDIESLLARRPRELSGGQRQRVAIGRAIVRKPKVFLFDEPLSNLDAELRTRMRYELIGLHHRLAATMIYVTHDQVEAMTLADRIVVLSKGRIEQLGAPLELYHQPANLFVAGFIGSPRINLLPAEIAQANTAGAVVRLPSGVTLAAVVDATTANIGDKATLGVRPEAFTIGGGAGAIDATIDFVERLGNATYAYARCAQLAEPLTIRLPDEALLKRGDAIQLSVNAAESHLFDASGAAFRRTGRS